MINSLAKAVVAVLVESKLALVWMSLALLSKAPVVARPENSWAKVTPLIPLDKLAVTILEALPVMLSAYQISQL
jgi:hypothetical protein